MNKPAYLYYVGDHDPSGVHIDRTIERRLREMAPDAEIHFQRRAVLPEQIQSMNLPTRPTKTSDSRAKGFGDISVELDAIEPGRLRALVQETIEQHLPAKQYEILKATEASERQLIAGLVGMLQDRVP